MGRALLLCTKTRLEAPVSNRNIDHALFTTCIVGRIAGRIVDVYPVPFAQVVDVDIYKRDLLKNRRSTLPIFSTSVLFCPLSS